MGSNGRRSGTPVPSDTYGPGGSTDTHAPADPCSPTGPADPWAPSALATPRHHRRPAVPRCCYLQDAGKYSVLQSYTSYHRQTGSASAAELSGGDVLGKPGVARQGKVLCPRFYRCSRLYFEITVFSPRLHRGHLGCDSRMAGLLGETSHLCPLPSANEPTTPATGSHNFNRPTLGPVLGRPSRAGSTPTARLNLPLPSSTGRVG